MKNHLDYLVRPEDFEVIAGVVVAQLEEQAFVVELGSIK
jgi:hypothetical protein